MAVKQDTRQKLLFAIDDFPAIEAGKCCNRCKVCKSPSEFYTVKRKSGEGRTLSSICKRCDNGRRVETIHRVRGPDWVDGNARRREQQRHDAVERKAEKERQRTKKKELKQNQFGAWTKAIRDAIHRAMNSQRGYEKSGWNRKCETAMSGLRNRTPIATGKGFQKCNTWKQRCKAANLNLLAVMKRAEQSAWKKKCATCALNHKRKHRVR